MNIVAAGIPRSGSTRLYNIIRLGMLQFFDKDQINAGWINSYSHKDGKHNIVKVHDYDPMWLDYGKHIFTTKRDIRYIASSAYEHKPYDRFTKPEQLVASMHNVLKTYNLWKGVSDYEVVYEDFPTKKEEIVRDIFKVIGLPVNVSKVLDELSKIGNSKNHFNEDGESLMHIQHFSPNTHLNYRDRLPPDFVELIDRTFSCWVVENGYELDDRKSKLFL